MRPLLLAALVTAAASASAQGPVALNGPIPRATAAALPDAALFAEERGAGGSEPDTTSPWRYFPLHVGDRWEYLSYNDGAVVRRAVVGDTTVDGQAYHIVTQYYIAAGGAPVRVFRNPIRFDTLSALAMEPYGDGTGREAVAGYLTPCLLDAAWESSLLCENGPNVVSGGDDGRLVFGGTEPGTGTDTVTVTYKRFLYVESGVDHRYAAGFGLVYYAHEEAGLAQGLYFARVNGVVHGVERYPGVGTVAAEPEPAAGGVTLRVSPNPARGRAVAAFALERAGPVALALYDATGRRVLARELGALEAGRHEAALDLDGLAPGFYLARVAGPGGAVGRTVTVGG